MDYDRSQPAQNRIASRIDAEIERVKDMTARVARIRNTIVGHARTLGYFEPPKSDVAGAAPTPIIGTLSDALGELNREIEHLDGSMNLFN